MSVTPKAQADLDLAGLAALLKVSCTRGLELCNREALQILGGESLHLPGDFTVSNKRCRYWIPARRSRRSGRADVSRFRSLLAVLTFSCSSRDLRVMCVGGGSDEIMGQSPLSSLSLRNTESTAGNLGLKMAEALAKVKSSKI